MTLQAGIRGRWVTNTASGLRHNITPSEWVQRGCWERDVLVRAFHGCMQVSDTFNGGALRFLVRDSLFDLELRRDSRPSQRGWLRRVRKGGATSSPAPIHQRISKPLRPLESTAGFRQNRHSAASRPRDISAPTTGEICRLLVVVGEWERGEARSKGTCISGANSPWEKVPGPSRPTDTRWLTPVAAALFGPR